MLEASIRLDPGAAALTPSVWGCAKTGTAMAHSTAAGNIFLNMTRHLWIAMGTSHARWMRRSATIRLMAGGYGSGGNVSL
jgi:hypothetical protein